MTALEIYQEYVKRRNNFTGEPRRIPRSIPSSLTGKKLDILNTLELYFNTKWINIDVAQYFDAGFDVYQKNFYVNKWLSPRIIQRYIARDKASKLISDSLVYDMSKSLKFVLEVTKEHSSVDPLYTYSRMYYNIIPASIEHYRQGKVSSVFIAYMISTGYLEVSDDIKPYIEPVVNNYREYIANMRKLNMNVKKMIKEIKDSDINSINK
jgi:hypothetical protein